MKAQDIMTSTVETVSVDATVQDVAKKLCALGISALPVVDATGAMVGIVSEGDLIGRNEPNTAHREWWLTLLAEGETLNPEFLATFKTPRTRKVREIMSAPVITVTETADTAEIAKLLWGNRIKRVPVLRDGRIVGIVSRADLVRAMTEGD